MLIRKPFIFLILVAAVSFGGLFYIYNGTTEVRPNLFEEIKKPEIPDSATERKKWLERINDVGAEQAYEEFKKEYELFDFGTQHIAAHLMGELLYEKEKFKGLIICDATFAFGCYHSFFGKAISENGIRVIPDLDKACVEEYGPLGTGCQHGIGHGILEYIGHHNLTVALNTCTMTTQLKDYFGCTSGVFMEYNIPVIFTDENVYSNVRKFNPDNPHEPCNTIVPEKFRKSCYYEIGQWWEEVLNGNYEKIGKLCRQIENKEYQESCYLGVGNVIAPLSTYNVDESINRCKKMPDHEAEFLCRAGASWSFFAEPEVRHLAPKVCEGFEKIDELRCISKSDLINEGEDLR